MLKGIGSTLLDLTCLACHYGCPVEPVKKETSKYINKVKNEVQAEISSPKTQEKISNDVAEILLTLDFSKIVNNSIANTIFETKFKNIEYDENLVDNSNNASINKLIKEVTKMSFDDSIDKTNNLINENLINESLI